MSGGIKLDSVDLKIVELLSRNARMECKAIGKTVGISDRTVARRIESLEKKGIIHGYTVRVDEALAGAVSPMLGLSVVEDNALAASSLWDRIDRSLQECFGAGATIILSHIGSGIGSDLAEKLAGKGDDPENLCLAFTQILQARGWGKLKFDVINFRKGSGRISYSGLPPRESILSHDPIHHIIRGILAGFLSTIFKKKLTVTETKCTGKGDEYCEFTFTKTEY